MVHISTIFLMGGASSRFWPLSEMGHKGLMKIMGRRLVEWVMLSLKDEGITDFVIVQGPDQLPERLLGDGSHLGVKINYAIQKQSLGMGNAVEQAREFIQDYAMVLFPYHYYASEIFAKMKPLLSNNPDAVFWGLPTDQPWKYGIFKFDEKDRVIGLVEKPAVPPSNYKIGGVYLLSKKFFDYHSKVGNEHYSFEAALDLMIKDRNIEIVRTENFQTATLKYTWDLIKFNQHFSQRKFQELLKQGISKDAKIAKSARISGDVAIGAGSKIADDVIINGPVYIGEKVRIFERAVIKGPVYIGDRTIIGNSALVRDGVHLGSNNMIGANAEVTRCFFMDGVHTHDGFFGDSVFAPNVKVGAGSITANVRLDRGIIYTIVKDKKVNTNLRSLGAIIGPNTGIGIHTDIMPGVHIGANNQIVAPRISRNVPSNVYVSELGEAKPFNWSKYKVIIFDGDYIMYDPNHAEVTESMMVALAGHIGTTPEQAKKEWRAYISEILEAAREDSSKVPETYRPKVLQTILERHKVSNAEGVANKLHEQFKRGLSESTYELVPDLQNFLSNLKKKHALTLATDAIKDITETKLDKAIPTWRSIFDKIITREDTQEIRPSQKYYTLIMKELGVEPKDCLVIGDRWKEELKAQFFDVLGGQS